MALDMILGAFLKTLGQMGDPRFRRVLLLGVGLTLALLIASSVAVVWLIQTVVGDSMVLPIIGEVSWVGSLLSVGSLLAMALLSVFLMVPVASAMTSLFLDEVAQAVEDRHYPGLPPVPNVPLGAALRDTVGFLGVLLAANLVALVLYVMVAPLALFIFWGLNGYLLGREYFQLAAMRREGRAAALRLQRRHWLTIWAAGVLMAIPLTVPGINLLIPILGAATFTHIYHAIRRQTGPSG